MQTSSKQNTKAQQVSPEWNTSLKAQKGQETTKSQQQQIPHNNDKKLTKRGENQQITVSPSTAKSPKRHAQTHPPQKRQKRKRRF